MNTEILGVVAMFVITLLLAIPFGKYISKVFTGEKHFGSCFKPVERFSTKYQESILIMK